MPECAFPYCKRNAEKNGYCVGHRIYAVMAIKSSHIETPAKAKRQVARKKPVNKKTKKLAKAERAYRKIVLEMLAADPYCQIRSPVCMGAADGLHHMRGRGKRLNDRDNLKPACNACNSYVESHRAWAEENGHCKSRLAKPE